MAQSGLTTSGIARLHRVLSGHIEHGDLPGLVALIARNDDVHVETLGTLSFGPSAPMTRDTIFRIASLTKPVAAVTAMILIDECAMRLDDSIEAWIPEMANRKVLKSISSPLDETVPANRAITVRDVLTYRIGFGSVMGLPGRYPIQKAIAELHIGGDGPPHPSLDPPTDEWIKRLGSLPLMAQPGERWMYQVSGDLLGVLIARVSGKSLGAFMRERIFEPLGMKDTAFHVETAKLDRLPTCYAFNWQTKSFDIYDGVSNSEWIPEPKFETAGGGLLSTLDDYFAFCKMMLNKGRHGRDRIVSRVAVETMTADQLTPANRAGSDIFFGGHSSWGFGMCVDIHRDQIYRTPGRFGWDGGTGTSAYTDPAEGLIGILLTQRMMDSPDPPRVFTDFWTTAYAAME
jgi:CubicO group peptidase (beta-lactamase class C family)